MDGSATRAACATFKEMTVTVQTKVAKLHSSHSIATLVWCHLLLRKLALRRPPSRNSLLQRARLLNLGKSSRRDKPGLQLEPTMGPFKSRAASTNLNLTKGLSKQIWRVAAAASSISMTTSSSTWNKTFQSREESRERWIIECLWQLKILLAQSRIFQQCQRDRRSRFPSNR